jgi:hypothetical protein
MNNKKNKLQTIVIEIFQFIPDKQSAPNSEMKSSKFGIATANKTAK